MKVEKKIIRLGIVSVAIVLFAGIFGVASSNAQGVMKEIQDRMDKNYKSLQTIRSNITMVKVNPQIGSKDTTSGTVAFISKSFKKKLYVRVDWTKPVEESMVVIGDRYMLYRPTLSQAIIGSTANAKDSGAAGGALAFMSMSKAEIQANYLVQYVGQEGISGAVQTWHIVMTPRKPSGYKSADLWVDSDGMPRQTTIKAQNDETTTVLLTNIEKNKEVKTSEFSLDVPAGTKIVKS